MKKLQNHIKKLLTDKLQILYTIFGSTSYCKLKKEDFEL